MNQTRQTLLRWASKVLPVQVESKVDTQDASLEVKPVDAEQLRQVAGGVADSTNGPKGNW